MTRKDGIFEKKNETVKAQKQTKKALIMTSKRRTYSEIGQLIFNL